jgi:hypothetical protein
MQRNFGNSWRVTDVTFRLEPFMVMIRLNHLSENSGQVSLSGEAGKQALAFEPLILGIGLPQSL